MSQDEQRTLPLEPGTQVPGALDHAWVVDALEQQHSFLDDGSILLTARLRCSRCGDRLVIAQFREPPGSAVPPCRPQGQDAQP